MSTETVTPMMRQYLELKKRNPDCILFFRLGDFYEMFQEDAKIAAKELDLTLTTRDRNKDKEDQIPMCGVPYHSVDSYIGRLVSKGYKVAICEQTEDPAKAKGLVERDIVRIVTPGTVTASSMLEEGKNNYIACIYENGGTYGIAFCDVSTGQFYATFAQGKEADDRAMAELGRFAPTEVLVGGDVPMDIRLGIYNRLNCCIDEGKAEDFAQEDAEKLLEDHFGKTLAELSLSGQREATVACGALLRLLMDNQKNALSHIRNLEFYSTGKFLELDITARRNLELTETLRDKSKKGSLLGVLDKTNTAMGGRTLRSWMEKPLLSPKEIDARLDAVQELASDPMLRGSIMDMMKSISDLERIMARIVTGSANGRDMISLAQGCEPLPELKDKMFGVQSRLLGQLEAQIDGMKDCCTLILKTMVDDPPFTVREGGLIRRGADPEIDRLRDIMEGGAGAVGAIEARERERTGIKTLKVGYNRVFGYYIEVAKGSKDKVPEDYIRKQTLTNGERFITPELKELESTILTAKDQITAMEYEIFVRLREFVALQAARVQQTAAAVGAIDALWSLAHVAVQQG